MLDVINYVIRYHSKYYFRDKAQVIKCIKAFELDFDFKYQ